MALEVQETFSSEVIFSNIAIKYIIMQHCLPNNTSLLMHIFFYLNKQAALYYIHRTHHNIVITASRRRVTINPARHTETTKAVG